MSEQLKNVLIDGLPCSMTDNSAIIVQRTIQQLQDQVENFKKKFSKQEEEEAAEEAEDAKRVEDMKAKDALILTLQTQLKDALDPAKRAAELADLDTVRGKARVLMGDTFKVDGKPVEAIRREVVIAKSGVPTAKDWGDAEVAAVFTHLTADTKTRNPINDARAAFSGPGPATNAKAEAYQAMVHDMENAWKNPNPS